MNDNIFSVNDVVSSLSQLLTENYSDLFIRGEIVNFKRSSQGHYYFNLVDPSASLSVSCFKGDAFNISCLKDLRDGVKVICWGRLNIFAKRGQLQLIVKNMFVDGVGFLRQKFEMTKKKLSQEGLFDLERKEPIPMFPRKVALITSKEAAAYTDFLEVFKRRSFHMHIVLIPTIVQGDKSSRSVISSLDKAQKIKPDVIVITRGGGSFEDLNPFNDEMLARKISALQIPVVSAVGHERDYTICDYISDKRVETPTAAAVLLTNFQFELNQKMHHYLGLLKNHNRVIKYKLQKYLSLGNPIRLLQLIKFKMDFIDKRLSIIKIESRLDVIKQKCLNTATLLEDFSSIVHKNTISLIKDHKITLDILNSKIVSLDPKKVLKRGYSLLYIPFDREKKYICNSKDFDSLSNKSKIGISFHDGNRKVSK